MVDARANDPRRHLLALVLLLVCGALLWTSERGRSITADEQLHMIRGHAFWWTHDTRLSYAHPPLANAITSLPYAGRGGEVWGVGRTPTGQPRQPSKRVPPETEVRDVLPQLRGWDTSQPLSVSTSYFHHDFRKARAELTGGRRVMMLWTLGLGLFLYLWAERRWGFAAGIVALALFSLHPTLLAHGRLVTTDMPMAAASTLSLAALIRWIEAPGWGRAALFGLAAAFMVACKHSGLPFVVVMSFMVLGAAALGRGGFAERERRARAVGEVTLQLAAIAVFVIFTLDAIYLFDRVGLTVAEILAEPEPHNWISKKFEYALLERSPIAKLPDGLPLPFPYPWLVGLATVSEQNAMGHGDYFFGPREHLGHPLYFPVMIVAKSPTALLCLLGLGAWLVVARWRAGQRPSVATSVLLIFAALTLASACGSRINIGVRHVLPLMPILILFAARSAQLVIDDEGPGVPRWLVRPWVRRSLLGAGLAASVAGAAWTFPAWLGDFNVLVGGPEGGHEISIIGEDWGQDMGDVALLANEQGWERVVYYGSFPLRADEMRMRGVKVSKIKCKKEYSTRDPAVVHVTDWVRRRGCLGWLGEREPDYVVNHHMLVFVSPDGED